MAYLMALDQGTSSTRTLVFNLQGQMVAVAQQPLPQHFPQPGWVEHDATQIWQHQLATMQQALQQARLKATDIAAIGITNQRETVVLWDKASGQPLGHALVWQDRRTQDLCEQLKAQGYEAMVRQKTGLVLDPYFSASKMKWLLDHYDPQRERSRRGELALGTIDTWLLWNLTRSPQQAGLHRTEPSNASRTQLFNLHTGRWDEELLALFDIPLCLLPEIVASSGVMGHSNADLLGAAVPIGGMAGDQQAALFGQCCLQPGQIKATYGTGCFLLMHTGGHVQTSHTGLISTAAAQRGPQPQFALEGSVFMAGAVVQWLRDGLGIIGQSSDVEALARSVPDTEGVMMVPAFTGLGAPYWRADARAALVGMSRGSTKAHIARAALESIALQTAAVIRAMQQDRATRANEAQASGTQTRVAPVGPGLTALRVDGGACQNDLLMQMQADLLGIDVLRPKMTEVTALGAAMLAGLAVGVLQPEACAQMWQLERCFEPQQSRAWAEARWEAWEKAVRQTLAA